MNSVSTNLGASVEIRDANGAHFPAGTRLKLQSNGHSFTIGYGGLTYLPEIADENTLIVQLPTSQCIAKFRRSDGVNSAGAIGPVRCVPQ
jgi:outer membrane usher protein